MADALAAGPSATGLTRPRVPSARRSAAGAERRLHDRRRRAPHCQGRGSCQADPAALRDARDHAGLAIVTRVLLVVEAGASVTLVESHEGANGVAHQANTAVEIIGRRRGRGRSRQAERLWAGGHRPVHARRAMLGALRELHVLGVSRPRRRLSRHQLFLRFAGEHSSRRPSPAARCSKDASTPTRRWSSTTPCPLREPRAVQARARRRSDGRVPGQDHRAPVAQKTDGRMMSQAVLLADGATMNNKPELEIFADDVQCAHGATCGALDDDLLFYLRARGCPSRRRKP